MTSAPSSIKLAAIVAIDIVGYSELTKRNPEEAIRRVELLRQVVGDISASGGGRTFNTGGDSMMLVFKSATSAVDAVKRILGETLGVRIGVHVGEVSEIEGKDLLGHVVNLATRLQQNAGANAALISESVRQMVQDSVAAELGPAQALVLLKPHETVTCYTLRLPAIAFDKKGLPSSSARDIAIVQADFSRNQNFPIPSALRQIGAQGRSNDIPPRALRSLNSILPLTLDTPLAAKQKLVLYGGFNPGASLGFSPLQHVLQNHTFARDVSTQIVDRLKHSKEYFSASTILARPGQGKSITLMQVVCALCKIEGFITFWSLDAGTEFCCEDDLSAIDEIVKIFEDLNQKPKRIVFAFDDLHKRTGHIAALHRFYGLCKIYSERKKAPISFLFTSDDSEIPLSTDGGDFVLELSQDEEQHLYKEMSASSPVIVTKKYETIEELIAASVGKRDYRNDVQGLIELIIDNATPISEFRKVRFSDLSAETPLARTAITILAVSQVLDLPVPIRIAVSVMKNHGATDLVDAEAFIRLSKRISRASEGWAGLTLSSPYYAQSVLRSLDLLSDTFVESTLTEVIGNSFEFSSRDPASWALYENEYIRHIFQRLSKQQLYLIPEVPNKAEIADELFLRFRSDITGSVSLLDTSREKALWAGTLSGLPLFLKGNPDEDENSVSRIVCDLCASAMDGFSPRPITDARVFMGVAKATRRLLKAFGNQKRVHEVAVAVEKTSRLDVLMELEAKAGRADSEWRANEILDSYIDLADATFLVEGMDYRDRQRFVFNMYLKAEREFSKYGWEFDVGNAVRRANSVIVEHAPRDVDSLATYIKYARDKLRMNTRTHNSWRHKVEKMESKFERRYGPLDLRVRESIKPQHAH